MKIKIENILDKLLKKLNLKRIETDNKGKVIKFENDADKVEEEVKKARKGAIEIETIKDEKKLSKKGISILTSMILLLLLTITLGLNSSNNLNNDTVSPKEISSVATSSSVDDNSQMQDKETVTEDVVLATKATPKKVEEKLVFSVPLDGEIQKMYSTDKVIYSKTLGQWKTHDGLDISASNSSTVNAIERGVVDDIYNDSFLGMTIVIEHISGYKSQYSNLDEDVFVSIGESVVKGQKIGKVGNTSVGEYLDDAHLHFMLFLNDESIDPTYIYN